MTPHLAKTKGSNDPLAKANQQGGQGGVLLPQNSAKAIDTRAEIAAAAKANQIRKPADFVSQNSAEQIDTRAEIAAAAKAKANQQGGQGGVLLSANSPEAIDTRKEIAAAAKAKANQGARTDIKQNSAESPINTRAEVAAAAGMTPGNTYSITGSVPAWGT